MDEDDEEEYKEISYVKPSFDCDKIYQLIEETVDKIFLPTLGEGEEAEPQPYVSPVANWLKNFHLYFNKFRSTMPTKIPISVKNFPKKFEIPSKHGERLWGEFNETIYWSDLNG